MQSLFTSNDILCSYRGESLVNCNDAMLGSIPDFCFVPLFQLLGQGFRRFFTSCPSGKEVLRSSTLLILMVFSEY